MPKQGSAKKGAERSRRSQGSLGRAKPGLAGPPAPWLRQVPLYEFWAGGLMGYVRLCDPGRGLEFHRAGEGKSLPASCREVLALRHYLARGQAGLLAPREEAECSGAVRKGEIVFEYGKAPKWPVTATARYELLAQGGVDVTIAFSFSQALRGFEAGVETVIPAAQPVSHVHTGGRWRQVAAGPRMKLFFPRNAGAAELIADGRWNGLRMAGIGLSVEPQGYDYPLLVVKHEASPWALAHMALTEECSSVWVNGADRTVGMGLVGADVKARSSATCRARVLLCQVNSLDDVLPYYRQFVQEARATRRR